MRVRAILALAVVALGTVIAGPTQAAVAYPVKVCATLAISTTHPLPGETITISGVNFVPNASVRLELHDPTTTLKTVTADAHGSFTTTVTLPSGITGNHVISAATGAPTGVSGCPVDPGVSIGIQSANPGAPGNGGGGATNGGGSNGGATNGGGSNGGGTAFTGLDVLALLIGAIVLVGGGALVNRSGKRRRAASTA